MGKSAAPPPLHETPVTVLKMYLECGELLGSSVEMSRVVAVKQVKQETGVDLLPLLGHNHVEEVPVIPTELGQQIEMGPRTTNKALEKAGLQELHGKNWMPTEKGKLYCTSDPYQSPHSTHTGYQIKWFASRVIPLLS